MLLYGHDVLLQIRRTQRAADQLRAEYDSNEESARLLPLVEELEDEFHELDRMLPGPVDRGHAGRHIYFIRLHVSRRRLSECRQDIIDLSTHDVERIKRRFTRWCREGELWHPRLGDAPQRLLAQQELDSVVRRAFAGLTNHLRELGEDTSRLDGKALVRQVLGDGAAASERLSKEEREALRQILEGAYVLFRHRFSHGEVRARWDEALAAVTLANWAMQTLEPPGG